MFRVSTTKERLSLPSDVNLKRLFEWLPHDDSIIVIKKVHYASADWGIVELDFEKMKNLNIFLDESFPIEYGIELMAQAVGLTGAAQSYLKISEVKQAKQVFITGFKNLNFYFDKIPSDQKVFIEILETKSVEGFKFCNCQIFQLIDEASLDFEAGQRNIIAEGTVKAFIIYK